MSNIAGTPAYTKERTGLLQTLGNEIYNLKFHTKDISATLAALSDCYTVANGCIPMAAKAKDGVFEKACRDLQPVLHTGIQSVRKDSSPKNRLELARQIEAAVPLSLRDPDAHARAKTVQRYELAKQ